MKVAIDLAPLLVELSKEETIPLCYLTVLAIVVEDPGVRQSQLLREYEVKYTRQALHNYIKRLNTFYGEPVIETSKQTPEGEVQGLFPTAKGVQVVEELKKVALESLRLG